MWCSLGGLMSKLTLFILLFLTACFEPKPVNTPVSETTDEIVEVDNVLLPPGVPTVGLIEKDTSSATINWYNGTNGGAPDSFDFMYSTQPNLSGATTQANVSSPLLLDDLAQNTLYYFIIIAKNAAGQVQSIKSSFRTDMRGPSKPSITSIKNITKNSAQINWSESEISIVFDDPFFDFGGATKVGNISNNPPPPESPGESPASPGDNEIGANSGNTGSGPVDVNAISLAGFTNTLHPVMLNRCANCHNVVNYGTSAHGAADAQEAHDAMFFVDTLDRSKVDLDTPTDSRIYTKVMEGHQCGTVCAPEILSAINDWINQGAHVPVEDPVEPPEPGDVTYKLEYSTSKNFANAVVVENPANPYELEGLERSTTYYVRVIATNQVASTTSRRRQFKTKTPPPGGGPIDYKVRLRVGDRRYVESVLKDVFGVGGNTNDPGDSIRLQVFENSAFGGGCDRYSGKIIDNNTIEHTRERCFGGMGVSDIVTFNPMRAAAVSKACDALVHNSSTFGNAMIKISSNSTPAITDEVALKKAYHLFYPHQDLPQDLKTSLIALGNTGSNGAEKWRHVILGLCVSPEWQTLY